ncbi:MAG: hypothetical protein ACLGI2_12865 [Acidimicrobiia bacterium]
MEYLAYLLGPLGCALAMVVLMALMARGMRRPERGVDPAEAQEVAELRAEIAELRGKPSGAGDA